MSNADMKIFRAEFVAKLHSEALAQRRAAHKSRTKRYVAADSVRDGEAFRDAWADYMAEPA